METLVLVRHGPWFAAGDRAGHLSKSDEIHATCKRLQPLIEGKRVKIIYSPTNVALESAFLIGELLKIPELQSDVSFLNYRPKELAKFIQSHQKEIEILIVVASLEVIEWFPHYYLGCLREQRLHRQVEKRGLISRAIGFGEAVIIENETIRYLTNT